MIKLQGIHMYYNDYKDEYTMKVTVGDDNREITFKMTDEQTRKTLVPLVDIIVGACEVSAREFKEDIISAIKGNEDEKDSVDNSKSN